MSRKSILNKWDIILLILFLLIGGAILLIVNVTKKNGASVQIQRDSEVIDVRSLSDNGTFTYKDGEYENTLVIIDGTAYVTCSNCPDKLCEKQGVIEIVGETIICLPHKFIVEVVE